MAIPAEGFYFQIIMTLIAKFGFIGVAFHATVLKTLFKDPAVGGGHLSEAIPADHIDSPLIEYFHMGGDHRGLGFDTFFFFHGLNDRGIYFPFRLGGGFPQGQRR